MKLSLISQTVREALRRRDSTPFRAAVDAGLPGNAIRHLLDGHEPKTLRLAEICEAVGLEFYVGPPRDERPSKAEAQASSAMAEEAPPWVAIREDIADIRRRLDDQQLAPVLALQEMPGMRAVGVVRTSAAAGHGSLQTGETATGVAWFPREWLERRAIDPTVCTVIRVHGESMEPTLPDSASILVDRSRRECRDGRIFVLRTEDGLVVKRTVRNGDEWLLASDNPSWDPVPCRPSQVEVIGEVKWMAREFP